LDVMPASGRMQTKLISKPEQSTVIETPFPPPWVRERPILINFDLWRSLSRAQRDLVILRAVSWLVAVRWFKPGTFQILGVMGLAGGVAEILQADLLGMVMASGLAAVAGTQIWRENRSEALEIEADDAAVRVAQRRGYSEQDAATHLLSAITTIAQIEGRPSLTFSELIRSQNLRKVAGLSPVSVPDTLRKQP
jgi:Protein of unknown function (DUF3318)